MSRQNPSSDLIPAIFAMIFVLIALSLIERQQTTKPPEIKWSGGGSTGGYGGGGGSGGAD